jgi:hypothetical protein
MKRLILSIAFALAFAGAANAGPVPENWRVYDDGVLVPNSSLSITTTHLGGVSFHLELSGSTPHFNVEADSYFNGKGAGISDQIHATNKDVNPHTLTVLFSETLLNVVEKHDYLLLHNIGSGISYADLSDQPFGMQFMTTSVTPFGPHTYIGPLFSLTNKADITLVGEEAYSGSFSTYASPSAPEPTTITLLGIGIAGMAGYAWRRKRQQAKV